MCDNIVVTHAEDQNTMDTKSETNRVNAIGIGAKKGTIFYYVPSPYWPKSCYCWTKVVIE